MFPQTIGREKRLDRRARVRNSCALRASLSMLTPHSSRPVWAI